MKPRPKAAPTMPMAARALRRHRDIRHVGLRRGDIRRPQPRHHPLRMNRMAYECAAANNTNRAPFGWHRREEDRRRPTRSTVRPRNAVARNCIAENTLSRAPAQPARAQRAAPHACAGAMARRGGAFITTPEHPTLYLERSPSNRGRTLAATRPIDAADRAVEERLHRFEAKPAKVRHFIYARTRAGRRNAISSDEFRLADRQFGRLVTVIEKLIHRNF